MFELTATLPMKPWEFEPFKEYGPLLLEVDVTKKRDSFQALVDWLATLGTMVASLRVLFLGVVKYGPALRLQEVLAAQRHAGAIPDTLLVLQHFPVYTIGKRRTLQNLHITPEEVKRLGAELYETPRGGDITFHGPGQVVLYPILGLRQRGLGARAYVEGLEDVMTSTAAVYGIEARGRLPQETGVWVEDRKLGALGVRISQGVTSHGLAFNVDPDLSFFKHIVPCGIVGKGVTSLQSEMRRRGGGGRVELDSVAAQLVDAFVKIFGYMGMVEQPMDVRLL